jgi:hypothetical protein
MSPRTISCGPTAPPAAAAESFCVHAHTARASGARGGRAATQRALPVRSQPPEETSLALGAARSNNVWTRMCALQSPCGPNPSRGSSGSKYRRAAQAARGGRKRLPSASLVVPPPSTPLPLAQCRAHSPPFCGPRGRDHGGCSGGSSLVRAPSRCGDTVTLRACQQCRGGHRDWQAAGQGC